MYNDKLNQPISSNVTQKVASPFENELQGLQSATEQLNNAVDD